MQIEDLSGYDVITGPVAASIVAFIACCVLLKFKSRKDISLLKYGKFWLFMGLYFYFSGSTTLWLLENEKARLVLDNQNTGYAMWLFHWMLVFGTNAAYTIGGLYACNWTEGIKAYFKRVFRAG